MSVYYGENKIKAMRKGTQRAIAIYKGSRLIFQEKMAVVADSQHVTLEGLPEFVLFNDPLVVSVAPEEGYALISVQVIMNGEDITSEVYANNTIAIPEVKGEISIAALASPPIVFEDEAVKAICVENWGGQYIEGEITEYEASRVTTLGTTFASNTAITSFDELRYFTGLTTLSGAFRDCSNLTSAKVPKAPLTSMFYAFYGCSKITSIDIPTDQNWIFPQSGADHTFYNCVLLEGELDLSSIRRQSGYNLAMSATFGYCKKVTKITLPQANGSLDSCFLGCSNLETIVTDLFTVYHAGGSYRFRNIIGANNPNTVCGKLKNITYGFRGQGVTFALDLAYAPLTHESALQVIDGLRTVSSTVYLTFSAATRATLTDDEIAVATSKGWAIGTRG